MGVRKYPRDIVGMKFNRLTVIEFDKKIRRGDSTIEYWKCRCDCGNITSVRITHLFLGHVRSCGCLRLEAFETRRRNQQRRKQEIQEIVKEAKRNLVNEKDIASGI